MCTDYFGYFLQCKKSHSPKPSASRLLKYWSDHWLCPAWLWRCAVLLMAVVSVYLLIFWTSWKTLSLNFCYNIVCVFSVFLFMSSILCVHVKSQDSILGDHKHLPHHSHLVLISVNIIFTCEVFTFLKIVFDPFS